MRELRLLWAGLKNKNYTYIIAIGKSAIGVIICEKTKMRIKILDEHKHRIKVAEVEALREWLPSKISK